MLPPYLEVVRFDAGEALKGEALREARFELLAAILSVVRAGIHSRLSESSSLSTFRAFWKATARHFTLMLSPRFGWREHRSTSFGPMWIG